ncbi:homoserine dehydrogenase [Stenotrophomonas sp. C3(2023)]|uniref:homoserine dehydrogenase n=1 Tax=Stenotrophomonas sp. C3(2023) TaxID=3080277 RepID=UPI00293CDAD4|nr:homoserine dehydrogenase [Stenotrophomonas sp. C3(2023)]MDV3469362.1 homoserine dehydrogenase [Stenotrophomonas sp. C3(2023)]
MNAQRLAPHPARQRQLLLLGTGTVGSAFVERYQTLQQRGVALPSLHSVANSRTVLRCGQAPGQHLRQARSAPVPTAPRAVGVEIDALQAGDVVVDATASDAVAEQHAAWLARGMHVVTANKLGAGAQLTRAQAIVQGCAASGVRYGDSATVGAGLPLLSSLRALIAGGDRIHAIEGVLSGSLAWLFHHYDGKRAFSQWVAEAVQAGFTEPDPRLDLAGEDVRRKLLILARASGLPLEAAQVRVHSLVPAPLARLSLQEALSQLQQLDVPVQDQWQRAQARGHVLRFVGCVDGRGAEVGLRTLPPDHPMAQGAGTDNRVALHSDRYREQPLLIQGPGAGATVTAAALLDDVMRIHAIP